MESAKRRAPTARPVSQLVFDAQAGMLMATDERQWRWCINPVVDNAAPPARPAAQLALAQVV